MQSAFETVKSNNTHSTIDPRYPVSETTRTIGTTIVLCIIFQMGNCCNFFDCNGLKVKAGCWGLGGDPRVREDDKMGHGLVS